MNDKVMELAEQAMGTRKHVPPVWQFYDHELKDYAELIIQECIQVLQKRYMGDNNREDMEVKRCIEDVKKHFGVE